ncbi:MAG TPA: hypothetical protein VHD33_00330, partial [Legionellaceae bacterium]|nr:hypothetical protein [Legionellaceae bacterium]
GNCVTTFNLFKGLLEHKTNKKIESPGLEKDLADLKKNIHYLPGQNDAMLDFFSQDLQRLSITCTILMCHLLRYCWISHGALVAACAFGLAAAALTGLAIFIYYRNEKKEMALTFEGLFALLLDLSKQEFEIIPKQFAHEGTEDSEKNSLEMSVKSEASSWWSPVTGDSESISSKDTQSALDNMTTTQLLRHAEDIINNNRLSPITEERVTASGEIFSPPANTNNSKNETILVSNKRRGSGEGRTYISTPSDSQAPVYRATQIPDNESPHLSELDDKSGWNTSIASRRSQTAAHVRLGESYAMVARKPEAAEKPEQKIAAGVQVDTIRRRRRSFSIPEHSSPSNIHGMFSGEGEQKIPPSVPTYKSLNFSLSLYRMINLLVYPGAILFGSGLLNVMGQATLLASPPPLAPLIMMSGVSALGNSPFLLMLSSFIDQLWPDHEVKSTLAHGLVYLLNLIMNVHITAYIAALMGHRMMTVYSLYALLGAGIVPATLCAFALVVTAQHYLPRLKSLVSSSIESGAAASDSAESAHVSSVMAP